MWPLSPLPPPPIPQGIKEQLVDYPDLLERLQQNLNNVVLKPSPATPPFELAVWMLKDSLESFNFEAKDERDAANLAGDAAALAEAEKKDRATRLASSSAYGMRDLDDLHRYFEENRSALR